MDSHLLYVRLCLVASMSSCSVSLTALMTFTFRLNFWRPLPWTKLPLCSKQTLMYNKHNHKCKIHRYVLINELHFTAPLSASGMENCWALEVEMSLISILGYGVSGYLTICVSTGKAVSPKQAVLAAVLYFILIRGDAWDWCHEY